VGVPKTCQACPVAATSRRSLLQGVAAAVAGWLTPAAAIAQEPRSTRPARGDLLVRNGDATGSPLTPADIKTGAPTVAWPMAADGTVRNGSRLNRLVVVRLDPGTLGERTRPRAADGIVAYSAVCTHTGCEVGTFLPDEQALYCECHQSKFDPRDEARVTDGPAPRSLPALPLAVADGRLTVTGPFSTRPGFEQG
jgi:Rieske Fe-S protein